MNAQLSTPDKARIIETIAAGGDHDAIELCRLFHEDDKPYCPRRYDYHVIAYYLDELRTKGIIRIYPHGWKDGLTRYELDTSTTLRIDPA